MSSIRFSQVLRSLFDDRSTLIYPAPRAELTGQQLISLAGLSALSGFLNAMESWSLYEDRFPQFVPTAAIHRLGKILADLLLIFAAGREQACDVDLLRTNPGVFGPVGSETMVSRFMHRIKDMPEAFTRGYQTMSRNLGTKFWAAAGPRNPAKRATKRNPLILEIDATLIQAHWR